MANTQIKKELNLNNTQDFHDYIDALEIREVHEAIKYFSKRFRSTLDNPNDEFILMHLYQVELFKQLNTNPDVKIKVEYQDDTKKEIYGYILYREHQDKKYVQIPCPITHTSKIRVVKSINKQ